MNPSYNNRPVYKPLGKNEIRLLTLQYAPENGHDELSPIRCELECVALEDLRQRQQNDFEPPNHRRWPGFDKNELDFSVLFKPKKRHRLLGVPERSWKGYLESLEVKSQTAGSIVGASIGALHPLSHRYVALSYAWGTVENQRVILVNGLETKVRCNLHAALLELRKSQWVHRGVRLWIDALCINQEDYDEREQQVCIMRSIYSTAWQVVIWLGPTTESAPLAYTALSWLARVIGSGDKLKEFAAKYGVPHYSTAASSVILDPYLLPWRDAVFSALRAFFAIDYWHRLWILQELAMSMSDAPVIWGSHSMSLHDIWVACEVINESESTVLRYMATVGDDMDIDNSTLTLDRRLEERHATPGQQWKHLLLVKGLRDHKGYGIESALPSFELSRQARASDDRDKVYGILGIPGVEQLATMSPNYRMDLTNVYIEFTRTIIMNGGLDIIRLVHSPVKPVMFSWFIPEKNPTWLRRLVNARYRDVANTCTHELASWAVCWTCQSAPLVRLPRTYHAHDGLPPPVVRFPGDGIMSLQAVSVDVIANLSAFNILEADESYPHNALSAVPLPNPYGDLHGLKEAFWHTITANSTSTGDKPPPSWGPILTEQRLWSPFGTSESLNNSNINFGLHGFALRNRKLQLGGGYRLGELVGCRGAYRTWGGSKRDETSGPHSELDERDAVAWASNVLAWRRLIVTGTGRLGLTVAAVVEGDTVAVLPGCSTPMILRPTGDGRGWKLVGEIFVYGLMDGETASMVRDGILKVEEINIY